MGGHNNGTGYSEQGLKGKIKSFFTSKSVQEEKQMEPHGARREIYTPQDVQIHQNRELNANLPGKWIVPPSPNLKEDLTTEKAVKKRKGFFQRRKERKALDNEERILLKREKQTRRELELLLEETQTPEADIFEVREIREQLEDTFEVFGNIAAFRELTPGVLSGELERLMLTYQEQLEAICQTGEAVLKKADSLTGEQVDLVNRIIETANGAQLASSRILLVMQERQFRKEDEEGLGIAQYDHEVEQFGPDIIEAIEFYTSNKKLLGEDRGYHMINGLLRGNKELADIPDLPVATPIRQKVLTAIGRLNTIFRKGQRETKKLYRGMNLYSVYGEKIYQPESLVGTSFCDKAYLSTSRTRRVALNFAEGGLAYNAMERFIAERQANPGAPPPERFITGDSLFEIVARKGAHSMDISERSEIPGENEVLFAPETKIFIHSMRLAKYPIVVTRKAFVDYNEEKGTEKLSQEEIDALFPKAWNQIYITVLVPVFQGEIR